MRVAALIALFGLMSGVCLAAGEAGDGWISLFDGKTLEGWKASENPKTFSVKDGVLIVFGPRAHLFYDGPVNNHSFKNFEFKADVMTMPGANSGLYVHTKFQPNGWPGKGYEIQVNNSHGDWRRTGSVYGVKDVREVPSKDNEWFTERIVVNGKRIQTYINDKLIVDYTEPDDLKRLGRGTFAIQGHDPKSKILYKNVMVKPLPD